MSSHLLKIKIQMNTQKNNGMRKLMSNQTGIITTLAVRRNYWIDIFAKWTHNREFHEQRQNLEKGRKKRIRNRKKLNICVITPIFKAMWRDK